MERWRVIEYKERIVDILFLYNMLVLQSHGLRTTKCRQMPQNSIICTLGRTQTQIQCEGINIKSEDMVKM